MSLRCDSCCFHWSERFQVPRLILLASLWLCRVWIKGLPSLSSSISSSLIWESQVPWSPGDLLSISLGLIGLKSTGMYWHLCGEEVFDICTCGDLSCTPGKFNLCCVLVEEGLLWPVCGGTGCKDRGCLLCICDPDSLAVMLIGLELIPAWDCISLSKNSLNSPCWYLYPSSHANGFSSTEVLSSCGNLNICCLSIRSHACCTTFLMLASLKQKLFKAHLEYPINHLFCPLRNHPLTHQSIFVVHQQLAAGQDVAKLLEFLHVIFVASPNPDHYLLQINSNPNWRELNAIKNQIPEVECLGYLVHHLQVTI